VKVIKFRGEPDKTTGVIEVRGIVNKDGSIIFGECTHYDAEFGKRLIRMLILVDLATFENMLEYFHGMCKDLCISA